MFNKYPEGYDLTILDTRYRYPRLGENGKYDKGSIEWGKTIVPGYLPQDNTEYFDVEKIIQL